MSRQYANLSNIAAVLDTKDIGVDLALQQHSKITHKGKVVAYKLICSHQPGAYSDNDYAEGVRESFDNRLKYVEKSFTLLTDNNAYTPVVSVIVTAMSESLPYNKEVITTHKFKEVTANVFMDPSDNIWHIKGEGDDRRIVQVADDNMDEIFASRQSRKVVHSSYGTCIDYYNGDYLFYYNPARNEIRCGYGLKVEQNSQSTCVVFDRGSNTLVKIQPDFVVEALAGSELDNNYQLNIPENEITATLSTDMARAHLDYMKKLYQGTSYFSRLEELVSLKKATGNIGMTTMKLV